MQSENFDKKVREAAENHHPPYDDMAWSKMEKLLDEHLPQKEDKRRRFFFLIFLFLLLGSSAWLLIGKPWKSNSKIVKQEQQADNNNLHTREVISTEQTNEDIDNNANINLVSGDKKENKTKNTDVIPVTGSKENENKNTILSANKQVGKEKKNVPDDFAIAKKNDRTQNNISIVPAKNRQKNKEKRVDKPDNSVVTIKKDKEKPSKNDSGKDSKNDPAERKNTEPALVKSNNTKADEKEVNDPAKELTDEKKDVEAANKENKQEKTNQPEEKQDNPIVNKPSNKKKQSSKKSNSLFFTLCTGPDFSFVGSEGPGKVKFVAGVGVGYTIKERFTIRTGFYTARKIYTAQPSDYKAPPDFYTYYPYLEKIDADCKVYEIPLLISYSFGRSAKQNWFASTGLSSYLMKRETYNYFYKYTPTSPTISREWTVPDRNNHFFSVLNLSAGYQRKVGKNFSLTIEPYMKIPLSGVGFGKVKLNSGGVLFSIGVHPFRQRK